LLVATHFSFLFFSSFLFFLGLPQFLLMFFFIQLSTFQISLFIFQFLLFPYLQVDLSFRLLVGLCFKFSPFFCAYFFFAEISDWSSIARVRIIVI
jgi:hypothetical protein